MNDPRTAAQTMLLQDPDWFEDLWLRYWANGGNADKFDFEAYVHRLCELDLFDLQILIWALQDLHCRLESPTPPGSTPNRSRFHG